MLKTDEKTEFETETLTSTESKETLSEDKPDLTLDESKETPAHVSGGEKADEKADKKAEKSHAASTEEGKDHADKTGEDEKDKAFPNAAQVFGISEDQLQTEFNRFKADKLFKKVFIELTDVQLTKDVLMSKLAEAVAYNLGGVTVLPDALQTVLKEKPAIDVYVAVCYPYGAESFEIRKLLVKKALSTSVAGVVLYFGQFDYRLKKRRQLVREYKKLLSYGKRKKVIVAVNIEGLTPAEMQDIASLLAEAGATDVRAVVTDIKKDDVSLDKFVKSSDGKFDITVTTVKTDDKCMVTALNLGAAAVACENAVEVAKCFKEMLNL